MKKYSGTLILVLTALIWGLAFVGQADAASSIPAFTFSAIRSFIGAAVLLVFVLIRARVNERYALKNQNLKKLLLAGVICGTVLSIAMNLQQYGITVYPQQVNNVPGRAGFLTAMYVILVPIIGVPLKKKAHPIVLLAAALSVFALWLLCLQNGFGGIYLGDILMIACAFAFSIQIHTVDTFGAQVDGVMLSCVQFFVAGCTSLIAALLFEKPVSAAIIGAAWLPIAYVGVLSSGVAYTLQIVGQKRTEPALASIVMSLESVFAVLGGWLIMGDWLTGREIAGCVMLFAAVMLAQLPQLLQQIKEKGDNDVISV